MSSTVSGWAPSWCSPTGPRVTPDDLKAHVRETLANYKVPREITILTELPRGSTGKILRNELHRPCHA